MNLRIDGKIITSLSNDELGATLQQIAEEIKRRRLPDMYCAYHAVMNEGTWLRGVKES